MLEKLGSDAVVYVRNENKFSRMLPGNQILKSLELLAKVELADVNVARTEKNVNQYFSVSLFPAHAMGREQKALENSVFPGWTIEISFCRTRGILPADF